ncbi:MAG: L28 family ribosomal protein [Patescibacteria group bacterium]
MAYRCDNCGKKTNHALQHRHKKGVAGGRWRYRAQKTPKLQKPNLHPFRGVLNGKTGKFKLCTKCLRTVKKHLKEQEEKLAKKKEAKSKEKKEKTAKTTSKK